MVGWPPDSRPPLGKGPTGKDRPKAFDNGGAQSDFFSSHDSEPDVADFSPPRTNSLSPSDITTTSPSRQMQVIDEPWDQTLIMDEHQSDVPVSSESTYQVPSTTPMPAPVPSKALSSGYPSYASSLPSSSRSMSSNNISSNNIYMTASPASYPNTSERSIHNYSSSSFANLRGGDIRDQSPRQQYGYSQPSYQTHDPNIQSPPASMSTPGHAAPHQSSHRDSPTPYSHRRSLTDGQTYSIGHGFPHLPNPAQLQQNMRPPDMHRLHANDNHDQQQTYRAIAYGPDGRLNSVP